MKKASKEFEIPRSTIHNKINNKHASFVRCPTTFTKHEEELLKICTVLLCDWGFPLGSLDLHMMVVSYLQKQKRIVSKFKSNIPGEDWARGFRKRWNLLNRIATNISQKHAKILQSELQCYFENIRKEQDGVGLHI